MTDTRNPSYSSAARSSDLFRFAVLSLILVGALGFSDTAPRPAVDASDPVFGRELIGYEYQADGSVAYRYRGEALPALLAEAEDPSLRTETSYTKRVGASASGRGIYELVAYAEETFTEEEGAWFYVEHATTTKVSFDAARAERPLATLFLPTAYAASIAPFSEAGDGQIVYSGSDTNTNVIVVCINGAEGDGGNATANSTNTTATVSAIDEAFLVGPPGEEEFSASCDIQRVFLPFDTSAMPGGSSVSAALLTIYVTSKANAFDDGSDYLTLVQSSQATHTTLADADYDNVGSTQGIDAGERKDITSISTSATLTFTLNATGRSWVNGAGVDAPCSATNGITCLAVRIGHDIGSANLGETGQQNSVTLSTSEQTGTSQDPYLTVTYTEPSIEEALPRRVRISQGFILKLVEGTLRIF